LLTYLVAFYEPKFCDDNDDDDDDDDNSPFESSVIIYHNICNVCSFLGYFYSLDLKTVFTLQERAL